MLQVVGSFLYIPLSVALPWPSHGSPKTSIEMNTQKPRTPTAFLSTPSKKGHGPYTDRLTPIRADALCRTIIIYVAEKAFDFVSVTPCGVPLSVQKPTPQSEMRWLFKLTRKKSAYNISHFCRRYAAVHNLSYCIISPVYICAPLLFCPLLLPPETGAKSRNGPTTHRPSPISSARDQKNTGNRKKQSFAKKGGVWGAIYA